MATGFRAPMSDGPVRMQVSSTVGHSDPRPLEKEVFMKSVLKPIFAALAGASLLAVPVVASAQHGGGSHGGGGGFHGGGGGFHGGGGGFHGGGGGFHGGGFHGGGFHGGDFHGDGFHGGGFHDRDHFRGGFPIVGGLGLGLALSGAYSGYYDDGPYGYYPDYVAPAPPPVACGSWAWNAPAGRYDWIPC
jgi:hypothetical protein